MNSFHYEKSIKAVGLKWEGTFLEAGAGSIRKVQAGMYKRLPEISAVIHPEFILGLSYHATTSNTTFTHYTVVEVEVDLPFEMVQLSVPTITYAKCEHKEDQNVTLNNRIETFISGLKKWVFTN